MRHDAKGCNTQTRPWHPPCMSVDMDSPPPSQSISRGGPTTERGPNSAAPVSQRTRGPVPPGSYHRWERPYLNFPQARHVSNTDGAPQLRRRAR
jgi:hypothetical protein